MRRAASVSTGIPVFFCAPKPAAVMVRSYCPTGKFGNEYSPRLSDTACQTVRCAVFNNSTFAPTITALLRSETAPERLPPLAALLDGGASGNRPNARSIRRKFHLGWSTYTSQGGKRREAH